MKLNLYRILAFLALIGLSVGFGFAFDGIATAIEKNGNPRPEELVTAVRENAEAYALPEAVLWATVRLQSDFQSNLVSENGAIGLMQLTPQTFGYIHTDILGEPAPESGMLYEPRTNLRAGAAYLSHLYEKYGVWEMVYAAYATDEATVDAWLTDPTLLSPEGTLAKIPHAAAADYIEHMTDTVALYNKLYYQP